LKKTNQSISNTRRKAQLYLVYKMYWYFSYDNTPCL
jgi:hypothetical protein